MGGVQSVLGMGTRLLGPTLLEYGNEEQKKLHLTRISRGEVRWCQGYSEPGAGSDLASLQTKAEDKGDHYLVNGQKIWTSGSLYADWCFCLVRTDPKVKQDGISFLLIDMKTPGIEVRPIRIISGVSPFSEMFFTDVKVPKENLVGQAQQGLDHRQAPAAIRARCDHQQPPRRRRRFPADRSDRQGLCRRRRKGPDRRSRSAAAHRQAHDGVPHAAADAAAHARHDAGRARDRASSRRSPRTRGRASPRSARSCWSRSWVSRGSAGAAINSSRRARNDARVPGQQGHDDLQRHVSEVQNNVIAKRILGLLDHQ